MEGIPKMPQAKEKNKPQNKQKQNWEIVSIINEEGGGQGEKGGRRRELKIEMPVSFALLKPLIGL